MGAIVTGGLGALGNIITGNANATADKYNATIAGANAAAARRDATNVGLVGEQEVATHGMAARQRQGSIKANQAASGVDVNTGSAADVRASQAAVDQLDALTIRTNAAREAHGYLTKAAGLDAEQQKDMRKAKAAIPGAHLSAATTFLGALENTGENYAKLAASGGLG